jgi:4-amino-4-deoxy-L-arabinose transferase-like glycosyltransferase
MLTSFDGSRYRAALQRCFDAESNYDRQFYSRRIYLVLIAVVIIVFVGVSFLLLGSRPLADYDEAIYAQVAREAADSHSLFALTWKGNPGLGRSSGWYEKPPLIIWLTELSFVFLGRNELAARVPIALFSIATVVLASVWSQATFKSNIAAVLTASVFFIAFQFVVNSSTLQMDIPVGFFILLSVYSFARAKYDRRYLYVFWFLIGLGVMAKNVIGLLPLPIAFFASVLVRDHSYLRARSFYLGIFIFFAVAAPWHLVETIKFGKSFWGQYLLYHLLTRWSTGIEGNGQPFQFYWNILVHQRLLFCLSIPSFAYVFYNALKGSLNSALVASGSFVIFMFFSLSHTKLPAYILPIYPFIAIAIGGFLAAACKRLTVRVARVVAAMGIAVCAILSVRYTAYLYNAVREDHYGQDSRAVGMYLARSNPRLDVYYLSKTGTKPSVIYYANRVIYYLNPERSKPERTFLLISDVKPPFAAQILFQTATQALYVIR